MVATSWWTPSIGPREGELLAGVLSSGFVNDGPLTRQFEEIVAARLGAAHAVAVTSGTTALFAALKALGVGPGDEVVIPAVTFVATANAVTWTGATPVLADVDPDTLTLSPAAAAAAIGPRTAALMPVHVSGRAADLGALSELARRHGLALVEDAAEALLSRQPDGAHLGTVGAAGCFSLAPNKLITSGQGGLVVTNDPALARSIRQIKDQGRPERGSGGDDDHPVIGFNLKFTDLQAAVALGQWEDVERRVEGRRALWRNWQGALNGVAGIRLPGFATGRGEVPLWVDAVAEDRPALEAALGELGLACRRFWHPLHRLAPYRRPDDEFPAATALAGKAVWLPSDLDIDAATIARAGEHLAARLGRSAP